jgi:hypothetical protein
MGKTDDGMVTLLRIALRMTIAVFALLVVVAVSMAISAHRAYGRAEDFCAAIPPGTSTRDLTIKALDQSVQVRTDIEPGALVVRFTAWGFAPASGECRATVVDDHVTATRVVRVDYN